jgi:hypothetical protein
VAFGSNAAAARGLRVAKMTVWRWRHDRSPLPQWVSDILVDLVQSKVVEAHEAQEQLRYFARCRLGHPESSRAAAPGSIGEREGCL